VPSSVEGGDLAYGLGDGREVLTQDRTVVAGNLRADLDVRVAGGHRVEAGAYPFRTDGRVVGDDRQDLDRAGPSRIVLVLLL
jgi:hypothetical protein